MNFKTHMVWLCWQRCHLLFGARLLLVRCMIFLVLTTFHFMPLGYFNTLLRFPISLYFWYIITRSICNNYHLLTTKSKWLENKVSFEGYDIFTSTLSWWQIILRRVIKIACHQNFTVYNELLDIEMLYKNIIANLYGCWENVFENNYSRFYFRFNIYYLTVLYLT